MGARGPVPNREDDLARPRERGNKDARPVTRGVLKPVSRIPSVPSEWHPIAKRFFKSLKTSGQADYYQDSDWEYAYMLCEELSVYKKPSIDRYGNEYVKRSGQMFTAILTAMSNLGTTEADRRRMGLELHAPVIETDEAQEAIDSYKQELENDNVLAFPTPKDAS